MSFPDATRPADIGTAKQQLPTHVYRVDPKGGVAIAVDAKSLPGVPNGLVFSPDYTHIYIVCAGGLFVGDVADGRVTGVRQIARVVIDGVNCGMDGVRVDVHGNLWCSSNAGSAAGYSGVTVLNASGPPHGAIQPPGCVADLRSP